MPRSRNVIFATILQIMGCGHSKSSIKGKKNRNKNNARQEEIPQNDSDDDDSVDSDVEEVNERQSEMKTLTGKTHEIPLTLAQKKLSCSQQNFFKMLDEKIENGRDYDDSSSIEKAAENVRLAALLKDWETASAGSRSLEGTPKKNTFQTTNEKPPIITTAPTVTTTNAVKFQDKRLYTRQNNTPIPQSVIHQSYGVTPMSYGQGNIHQLPSSSIPTYQPLHTYNDWSYQGFTPLCATQLASSPPVIRSTESYRLCSLRAPKPTNGIPYENNNCRSSYTSHPKPPLRKPYSNGDLIQQQVHVEQVQYRQAKELAQFRLLKEQQLIQQQQMQQQHNQVIMRNYQSSIHIPMAVSQSYKEVVNKNQIER